MLGLTSILKSLFSWLDDTVRQLGLRVGNFFLLANDCARSINFRPISSFLLSETLAIFSIAFWKLAQLSIIAS